MQRRRAAVVAVLAATTLLAGCAGISHAAHPDETPTPSDNPATVEPAPIVKLDDFPARIEYAGLLTRIADGPTPFYVLQTRHGLVSVTLHSEPSLNRVLVIAAPEGFEMPDPNDSAATFAALQALAELTGGSLQVVEQIAG